MPTFDEPGGARDEQGGPRVRARSGAHADDAASVLVRVLGRLPDPAGDVDALEDGGDRAPAKSSPMSTSWTAAGVVAPGRHEQSGLQRPERDGHVGGDRDARPRAPVSASTPLGTSTATTIARDVVDARSTRAAASGRRPPVPPMPEDPVDHAGRRRPRAAPSPASSASPPMEPSARPSQGGATLDVARGPTGTGHRPGSRDRRAWPRPRARRRRCCRSRRAGRRGRRTTPPATSASTPRTGDRERPGRPLHQGAVGHERGEPPPPRRAPGRRCEGRSSTPCPRVATTKAMAM